MMIWLLILIPALAGLAAYLIRAQEKGGVPLHDVQQQGFISFGRRDLEGLAVVELHHDR